MTDIEAIFNAIMQSADAERSKYHLTLGGAISALAGINPDLPVSFSSGGAPGRPHSYRGYYSDLSFSPDENSTVGDFLTSCRASLGQTFQGYKGGDFIMKDDTPLWTASSGNTGLAIIGVSVTADGVSLITKQVD